MQQLQQGTRDEDVFASLISSNEYFMNRANNDNAQFVTAIYQDVLNRTPSPMEVSNALAIIQNTSRAAYTTAVLTSAEGRGVFVGGWYQRYLNRSASAADVNTYVGFIASGGTFDQTQASILASAEFYNLAQQVPEADTSILCAIGGLLLVGMMACRAGTDH